MAIKNLGSLQTEPPPQYRQVDSEISHFQREKYSRYSVQELVHVKKSLDSPHKLKHKMQQLLEELNLIRDFQLAVPRDKNYREDDIDQEFDQAIDGVECVIQVIENFEQNLLAGEKIASHFDGRFYARR